jgi:hypothetical protein
MANFEKPSDWSVAPAGDWVSKEALQDRGAPQLGDPGYAEKSACECDTEEYDEGGLGGLAKISGVKGVPGVGRDMPNATGFNKTLKTSREGLVKQCPPGTKAEGTTCVPNPASEASPLTIYKRMQKDKQEQLEGEGNTKDLSSDDEGSTGPGKNPWALSTLPLLKRGDQNG